MFSDESARRRLEAITHPLIFERYAELEAAAPPDAVVVHDIPLLAEAGPERAATFDEVIVVDVPAELQIERMMRDRGWTREEAESRIAAQASREDRLAIATYVVDNTGSLDDLRAQVEAVYAKLTGAPARWSEAVGAVLGDLGHPDARVGVSLTEDDLVGSSFPDGSRHSTRIEPHDPAHLLVGTAYTFQNDANFWLAGAWGEALPRCPGHPHPMDARVFDEAAGGSARPVAIAWPGSGRWTAAETVAG